VFGGSGSNRTVMVTPAANRSGTAMITVTVADPEGATTSGTFLLTVNPVNDPPTISFVPDQQTIEGTATAPISLHVEDIETPAENLALSGSSSNTNLVPNANIVFGGAGAERTVTVTPAALQTGTAVISVTVTDADGGATTRGFLLTVILGQPLQFISNAMLSDGSFRMRLAGAPLQGTVIQVSSDLANWQPVFTNSDQASVVEWTDVSATNSAGRCYRAVR